MLNFTDVSPFLNFIYNLGHYIYKFFIELGTVASCTFNDFATGNIPTYTSPFTNEVYSINQLYINFINNIYDVLTTISPSLTTNLGEQSVIVAMFIFLGLLALLFFLIKILKTLIVSNI